MFSKSRNLVSNFWGMSILFSSGCTNLHSYQRSTRVPFLSTSSLTLAISYLFDNSHSNRCEGSVVLICISSMISDVEHLFIYLLANCLSSLEKCWLRCSTHFLKFGLFAFLFPSCMSSLFTLDVIRYVICKYVIPFRRLPFHFVDGFLCCTKPLLVCCSPSNLFLLSLPLLLVSNPKTTTKSSINEFTLCFLIGVSWFQVLHSSLESIMS